MSFCVYHRPFLLWPPAIIDNVFFSKKSKQPFSIPGVKNIPYTIRTYLVRSLQVHTQKNTHAFNYTLETILKLVSRIIS